MYVAKWQPPISMLQMNCAHISSSEMQCSSPFSKRSGLKLMHPIIYFDNLRSVRSNHSITLLYKLKCGILRYIIHQYNRNIVESGVKHHNYNPLFPLTFSSYTFHIVMNTFLSKTYN
jgi:hypothetical protein